MRQREKRGNGERRNGEKDRDERWTERVTEGLKFGEKTFFRLQKRLDLFLVSE